MKAAALLAHPDPAEAQAAAGVGAEAASPGGTTCRTLCLMGFVTADDVADPDERAEVLANARALMEPFGSVASVTVEAVAASEGGGGGGGGELTVAVDAVEAMEAVVVVVRFAEAAAAAAAARSIAGMVVSGEPIRPLLCDDTLALDLALAQAQAQATGAGGSSLPATADADDSPSAAASSVSAAAGAGLGRGAFVLAVEGLVAAGDVTDPDEAAEVPPILLTRTRCTPHAYKSPILLTRTRLTRCSPRIPHSYNLLAPFFPSLLTRTPPPSLPPPSRSVPQGAGRFDVTVRGVRGRRPGGVDRHATVTVTTTTATTATITNAGRGTTCVSRPRAGGVRGMHVFRRRSGREPSPARGRCGRRAAAVRAG